VVGSPATARMSASKPGASLPFRLPTPQARAATLVRRPDAGAREGDPGSACRNLTYSLRLAKIHCKPVGSPRSCARRSGVPPNPGSIRCRHQYRCDQRELVKALGIYFRTVQRYIAAGDITPGLRTAGGHSRWSVDKVRQQLRELNERHSEERE
jgi:hypothetical protein